jgi:hypothetical protein
LAADHCLALIPTDLAAFSYQLADLSFACRATGLRLRAFLDREPFTLLALRFATSLGSPARTDHPLRSTMALFSRRP